MRKLIIATILALTSLTAYSQAQTEQNTTAPQKLGTENPVYRLFPTQNYWTFLKLNTRNGKMWQVHFSVQDDESTGELVLNAQPLVSVEREVNGRFTLYPTENMYTFLLLDQIAGTVTQVQWSMDDKNRGIVTHIKPRD